MKNYFILLMSTLITTTMISQNSEKKIPYDQLPEYSEKFTAGTVAARQIDGLGFRFYWATEDLKETDLNYQPNNESRTTGKTVAHIYDLSVRILNTMLKDSSANIDISAFSFKEFREQTLLNLKQAADILRNSSDISQYMIKTKNKDFPFWNLINGPIADATWHCGQIASYRRTSGNPINPKINHFTGKIN